MDTQTGWLIGQTIARESFSHLHVKVAKQDSINSTLYRPLAGPTKNFRLPMPSTVLILPMEKRSLLPSARRWDVIGSVIVVVGKRISTFSTYKHKRPKV